MEPCPLSVFTYKSTIVYFCCSLFSHGTCIIFKTTLYRRIYSYSQSVYNLSFQADTVLRDIVDTPLAATLDGATQSPNLSPTKKKTHETSKRKISEKNDGGQKVPRMFILDGRPPVPLDVRYLGFNRTILEDKDFRRGKFLDRLSEG